MSKDITTSERKGGGGELLADPRHIRGDAKTIAALLSCGVVSEDVVNTLLRKTILLCAKAADSNKPREVAALWRVMIAAARLGEESSNKGPTVANQVNVTVNDERAIDRKRDIQTELEEIKLARERGNLIETKNVQAAFDILGRELAELADKMAAVSPECRDMLIDTIISADRQIAELVPDETSNT